MKHLLTITSENHSEMVGLGRILKLLAVWHKFQSQRVILKIILRIGSIQ